MAAVGDQVHLTMIRIQVDPMIAQERGISLRLAIFLVKRWTSETGENVWFALNGTNHTLILHSGALLCKSTPWPRPKSHADAPLPCTFTVIPS